MGIIYAKLILRAETDQSSIHPDSRLFPKRPPSQETPWPDSKTALNNSSFQVTHTPMSERRASVYSQHYYPAGYPMYDDDGEETKTVQYKNVVKELIDAKL